MASSLQEAPAAGNTYRLLQNRMAVTGRSLVGSSLIKTGPMTPIELKAGTIFTVANPPLPVPNHPGQYLAEVVHEAVHYIITMENGTYEPYEP